MRFLWTVICLTLVQCGSFHLRDHSFASPFVGPWKPYGKVMFTSNFVRLTSDQGDARAGIINEYSMLLRNWEVVIDFRVYGSTTSLYGDGFAFWYTSSPIKPGHALGAENTFRGLGVFYDTYSNHIGEHGHKHPYVSAMVNNGTVAYDHDHDGTQTQLAGCHSPFRNKGHKTRTLIRYSRDTLKVAMDIDNKNEWTPCFEVSGVKLPTGYYLGVSAATGELTDFHEILSIKTYDLGYLNADELLEDRSMIEPSVESAEVPRLHVPDAPKTSIGRIFIYILLVLFLLCCCVVAYRFYVANKRRKMRLY